MRTHQTLRLSGSMERQGRSPVEILEQSATLAVPIEEAREQCNLSADDCSFDTEIRRYLWEAQEQVEYDTQQQLVPALLRQSFSSFPGVGLHKEFAGPDLWIQVGRRPLLEVDQVPYLDEAYAQQVLPATDYVVDTSRKPGHIRPSQAADFAWPVDVANEGVDNVQVEYVGGMGDKFTVDDTADTITTKYRYVDGQRIQFAVLKASLPTGLEEAKTYYVKGSGSTFQVAAERGGAAIPFDDTGTDLQYVIRLTGLASQAVLLKTRQLFDEQAGAETSQAVDAYWRIINKMADPSYP